MAEVGKHVVMILLSEIWLLIQYVVMPIPTAYSWLNDLKVLEVDDDAMLPIQVKFMVRGDGDYYVWAENPEISWTDLDSIVCSVQAPAVINSRGHFVFPSEDIMNIKRKLGAKKSVKFE